MSDANPCPPDIVAALDGDVELTEDQFRRFLEWEASLIGITLDEARRLKKAGLLSRRGEVGADLDLLLGAED